MIQENYLTPGCIRGYFRPFLFLLLAALPLLAVGQESADDSLTGGAPALAAEAFAGMEEMTPQQQAAMQAYRSIEMENLINQLFKLEGRFNSLEQGQQADRQSIIRVSSLDSIREAKELVALRMNYRRSLQDITQLMAAIDHIRKLHDWEQFVGEATTLADPNSYEGFTTGLMALREEQKNSLSLPTIKGLSNPYFSSFYTLSAALGTKDEPEERLKIQRLVTILDYALQADKQLDYIAAELAFAGEAGNALYQRAESLRDALYGLVNLEPGKLDAAREKFFTYQFSTEFTGQHNETITNHLREVDALRIAYGSYQSMLESALARAAFSLKRIRPNPAEVEEDLAEILAAKKLDFGTKIEEAAKAVAEQQVGK